jgi:acyl transferase domain-containing protein
MASCPVPIAIVGMSCRFPGGADNPEKLWNMLAKGVDGWSEVPESRFRWESFYHPDPEIQAATNHRGGHFIAQDIAAFDAKFFGGIGVREAETMDPQQRMLLELTYEALENAGVPLDKFQGSEAGVYIATFNNDYSRLQSRDPLDIAPSSLTGSGQSILANRLSYVFDLKGPSVVVDTACSGSMVALHSACQSLRLGEVDVAVAGAANLILDPDIMLPLSMQR